MKKHRLPAAVLALAALGFTLGTCEFVIVGILPDIAAGLNVSLAAVGRLVSVFAACYAVGTPLLTALTGRMDRFRLLIGLMLLFLGVNVLSMLAPGVTVLYASRVVAALVSGTHRSGYAVCEGGFFPGADGPGHFRRVRGLFRGGGGGGAHRYSGVPRSWLAGHLWRDPGNGTGAAAGAGPTATQKD